MYRGHQQGPQAQEYWNQESGSGRIPQFHGQPRSYDQRGSSFNRRGKRRNGFTNGRVENSDGKRNDWDKYRSRGPPKVTSPVNANLVDLESDRTNQGPNSSESPWISNFGFDRYQGDNGRQYNERRSNEARKQFDDRRQSGEGKPSCRDQQTSKPGENPFHKERYYLSNRLPTGQFIDKRPGPVNGERRYSTNDEGPRPQVTVAEGDINRCPLLSTLPPAKEVVNNHMILPFANYGTERGKRHQEDNNPEVFVPDPNSEDEELRAMMDMKMEVLEFHYREKEAESARIAVGNVSILRNNPTSSNFPRQVQSEPRRSESNSVNSAQGNSASLKGAPDPKQHGKQSSAASSRRKEPASISASQLPVYSVKYPGNPEPEPSSQFSKKKRKNPEKAVEDEFEFPLAKKRVIKKEPNAEEPENIPQTSKENIPSRSYEFQEDFVQQNSDFSTQTVSNVQVENLPTTNNQQQSPLVGKQVLRMKYEQIRQKILDTETQMQSVMEEYFRLQEELYIGQNELDRVVYDLLNLDNS
ncbi:hypothetical protein FO519_009499 [Halicephalobus sp. NKZ332]|nr:hypothetical protein FO519_009499 [Halicephalobus sp. NKZ332]